MSRRGRGKYCPLGRTGRKGGCGRCGREEGYRLGAGLGLWGFLSILAE